MTRLGLFPLGLVLVPTERVPLHIFETRYKELIGECIDRGDEFGVLLQKPDGDAHEIGTRAKVAQVLQTLPDGQMDILVEGGDRFRLLHSHYDRSYVSGTVEEVRDVDDDPPDAADVDRALEVFAKLQETVGSRAKPPDPESPLLDFEIVARVDFGASQKQELIELTSPRRRFARLAELLERALEALSLEREVRQRAEGNGRVPSSPRLGS